MTGRNLTTSTCNFTNANQSLLEMTKKPDIMVAEMTTDRTLVYIDTLATVEVAPS